MQIPIHNRKNEKVVFIELIFSYPTIILNELLTLVLKEYCKNYHFC